VPTPLTDNQISQLRELSTCTVANAIESFAVRLRNEGFADQSIHLCTPCHTAVVGYAATIRISCSNPPMAGRVHPDRTDWWNYLLTIPGPRIVVIEDMDEVPGTGSFIGEVHASILQALQCSGVVTNGAVRDVPQLESLGMPVFATALAVSHAYAHVVEVGVPVVVGGLHVRPGDLLHADMHGVLSVPLGIADRIPEAAAKLVDQERRVIELCRSHDFSIEKLRQAVTGVFG
jgi:regulator of RNase E activity RraA